MFLYFPDLWFGDDKVARVEWLAFSVGDLWEINGNYALILGDTIAFGELYKHRIAVTQSSLVIAGFLSKKTMQWIHTFIECRFCSYDHALSLRIGSELKHIIKKLWKKNNPSSRSFSLTLQDGLLKSFSKEEKSSQQLIVFPDLRTLQQIAPNALLIYPWVALRHGGLTVVQQATIFAAIKSWQIHTLLTTHAGIFQDRYDLDEIVVIDAHKWRYKYQQDPRYWTPSVLNHLSKVWNTSYTEC